jgi:putative PEP-CTERM system histidine kinase
MPMFPLLSFAAAGFSAVLALASLLRKRSSPASWSFAAGMTALAVDSLLTGLALQAATPDAVLSWIGRSFFVVSLLPLPWLFFSVTYSRGDYRHFLRRWTIPLILSSAVPVGLLIIRPTQFVDVAAFGDGATMLHLRPAAKLVSSALIVSFVLTLMNLEQTFRAAVGTMRWRIKFVILALGAICGARIYVHSQALLFSTPGLGLAGLESASLIVGCLMLVLAYVRAGWTEIDVYPSRSVLQSSLTTVIVGGYLLAVGVLARLVGRHGGQEFLQFQAIVVVVGVAGLAVLLLSDRFRQEMHRFVARHFRKPQHDSAQIWTAFSRHLTSVRDQAGLCTVSMRLVSETFDVLSVSVWLLNEAQQRLTLADSTIRVASESGGARVIDSPAVLAGLSDQPQPLDLDDSGLAWVREFRQVNASMFPSGGHRWSVPLRAGGRFLGVLVLADRVGGAVYSVEEWELLTCIGDHITSVLLNLRLANEVVRAKELEAFQTMSAFFVHDLKNVASSLDLTLRNLPVHFDDPAFRTDALRTVGNSVKRIEDTIERLSALRRHATFLPIESDLNQLVREAISGVHCPPHVELTQELVPLPPMLADREQIKSVVTNLVLNAQEAAGARGHIEIRTFQENADVVLSVKDDGCGMGEAFVNESLFRPFQSTKKQGLGIGLFQSQAIVRAHGGRLQVESEPGRGTIFHVRFPVKGTR